MNVYDSERMADVLAPVGYRISVTPDDADLVILNTCHIREKAAEKVYSDLGRLRLLKESRVEAGAAMILAVAGCVAQAEGAEILKRAPFVDMVFGPQAYHRLPEMVAKVHREAGAVLETAFPPEAKFDNLPMSEAAGRHSAFVTIQEGCDKFCTFCVVPYTRGTEYSRPASGVVAEVKNLVAGGVREITLLGQNVNNYHGASAEDGTWSLGRLITKLAELQNLDRIRYTTSYPADVDEDLINAHREVGKLMPFLHLPIQSGADRVLQAMNRRHSVDGFRSLVGRLRRAQPDLALSSDFIVGFPGETDADFEQTLALVDEIGFVQAYSFKYSPRPGTPAAALPGAVSEAQKSARLLALQDKLNGQQQAFNESCVGAEMPVLLERRGRYSGQLVGRSPYMQAVHAEIADDYLGKIVSLRVTAAHPNSLGAVLEPSIGDRNRRAIA